MHTPSVWTSLRHRWAVWLAVALVLWGATVPVVVRAQMAGAAAAAGVVGLDICTTTAISVVPAGAWPDGDDSAPSGTGSGMCPWCLSALDEVLLSATAQPHAAPCPSHLAPLPSTAWVPHSAMAALPPSRGPPSAL